MGCDLHAVVCAPWDTGKEYDTLMVFSEPRDYRLFYAMAGVRYGEDVDPVAEPRGLPDWFPKPEDGEVDIAGIYKFWIGDHSFSWLTTDEFAEAIRRADAGLGRRDAEYYAVLEFMRRLDADGRPAIIVFGFDN